MDTTTVDELGKLAALAQAVATLQSDDAFGPRLEAQDWQQLAPFLSRSEIRAGDLLLRQDQHERHCYFLERGNLQVFVTRSTPGTHRISVLRAGSIVGEAALFGDIPRMANVEAMSNCVVWTLTAKHFDELSRRAPAAALKLAHGAAAVLALRTRANLERALPLS